jgi:nucleoside-diphosphate-sugar epimerase
VVGKGETTVAVTGSSGKLGRHGVRHLQEHGYRVVALDRVPDPGTAAEVSVRVDLIDHGQVLETLTAVDDRHDGVDAVVHLAAIPARGLATNAATFSHNITATYNVFAAARTAAASPRSMPTRSCGAGTYGPTSTAATAPRPSAGCWSTRPRVWTCS